MGSTETRETVDNPPVEFDIYPQGERDAVAAEPPKGGAGLKPALFRLRRGGHAIERQRRRTVFPTTISLLASVVPDIASQHDDPR